MVLHREDSKPFSVMMMMPSPHPHTDPQTMCFVFSVELPMISCSPPSKHRPSTLASSSITGAARQFPFFSCLLSLLHSRFSSPHPTREAMLTVKSQGKLGNLLTRWTQH